MLFAKPKLIITLTLTFIIVDIAKPSSNNNNYCLQLYLPFLVFICDTGKECFVWIGKKASIDERHKGLQYAHVSILDVEPLS